MLNCETDIGGGLFDSTTILRGKQKSDVREVKFYELELFIEEKGTSHIDGLAYPVRRGMLLCARPGQKRFSQLPVKCYFIRLFATDAPEAAFLDCFPFVTYLNENQYDQLCPLFFKLAGCYVGNLDAKEKTLHVNALFLEILYRCRQFLSTSDNSASRTESGNPAVMKAKEYIDSNFTEDCTLSGIAEHVHLSPNYLHKLFKSHMGHSPYEYLLEKKIGLAKRLILSGTYSLSEVALEAGFSSQSHFNKIFKKATGQTPADFRRKLTEEYL